VRPSLLKLARAYPKKRDALRFGGAARRQPLLLSITTAGVSRNSICWEQHQYAERVIADPMLDPTFYGAIYAADHTAPGFDMQSPKTWKKANPSLGHTITNESFKADAREAYNSPSKTNAFLRYRLNCWVSTNTAFFKPAALAKCKQPIRDLTGRVCYAGGDFSTTTDLSAFVIVSQDDDETLDVLPVVWIPEAAIETRSVRDKVDYIQWARDGVVRVTEGNAVDYKQIKKDILELCEQYKIQAIGVDPWSATMLSQQLADEMQTATTICNVRQGYASISEPFKYLERLVLDAKLRVDNPVFDWCALNVACTVDGGGNIKPSKQRSTERIDVISALCTALAVQMSASEPEPANDWQIVTL